jgi:glucose repression regulatory protein TUP1
LVVTSNDTVNSVPKYSDFIRSGSCEEDGNDWFLVRNINARYRFRVSLKQALCHLTVVRCVSFSKTGEYIATGSYNSVHIYNTTTFAKAARLWEESESNVGGSDVLTLSFSPDGQRLAIGKRASDITIWDLSELVILERLSGSGAGLVQSLEFSPCGNLIAFVTHRHGAKLWNMIDKSRTVDLPGPEISDSVISITFSPDGKSLAAGTYTGQVLLWNVADGSPVKQFMGHTRWVVSVAFSPNGRHLVSGGDDGTRLWNLDVPANPANATPSSTLSATKETSIVPWTREALSMSVWVKETRSRDIQDQGGVVSVCWSQDGKWIISGDSEGHVQFYDEAYKVLFVLFAHSKPGAFGSSLN